MYLVDTYQSLNGASAIAANGFLRYGLAFAFPLFALQSKSTKYTSCLVATNKHEADLRSSVSTSRHSMGNLTSRLYHNSIDAHPVGTLQIWS
jgi:hypothetical protein